MVKIDTLLQTKNAKKLYPLAHIPIPFPPPPLPPIQMSVETLFFPRKTVLNNSNWITFNYKLFDSVWAGHLISNCTNLIITCSKLVDPQVTAFEPVSRGQLVEGLQFHKFYFDTGKWSYCTTARLTVGHSLFCCAIIYPQVKLVWWSLKITASVLRKSYILSHSDYCSPPLRNRD